MTVTTVFGTKTKSTLNAAVRTSDVITSISHCWIFIWTFRVCVRVLFILSLSLASHTLFSRPFIFAFSFFSILHSTSSQTFMPCSFFLHSSSFTFFSFYAFFYHELFVEINIKKEKNEYVY